jgi:diacylglycerol O-acyltransferase / wax synthase
MRRMSPVDASFLHIEDHVSHMHIGSAAIFEGPAPAHEEILTAIRSKLPLVPRYRQKVRFVPLSLGRPVWVDDPHFLLEYHVRHTALPSPGADEQLRNLVGRIMSQQLDRSKPLWEIWIAEGLNDGRWVMVSKTHHCMVDGVASSDVLSVLMDETRDGGSPPADPWQPEPEPNRAQLVAEALAERIVSPYEVTRSAAAALRGPRRLARSVAQGTLDVSKTRSVLWPATPISINGPIGPHRRWDWARGRLADIKTIRDSFGGTVNDAVLTVITAGFRDLLQKRDEPVEGRTIRTMVPVSVRKAAERGTYTNKVSAMFAELPIGIDDPVERLEAVQRQMEDLKRSRQAVGAEVLTSLTGFAPAMLLALGARAATRMPQRNLNTVTTNVPGPQHPLYLAGRRLLEVFPYVPLGNHIRVGVAIYSYDGGLNFGITGDYDTVADLGVLTGGIGSGIAELVNLAQKAKPTTRPRRSARPNAAAKTSRVQASPPEAAR